MPYRNRSAIALAPFTASEIVSERDRPPRRHFSNELLVRKFDEYLTAINKSANTRLAYLLPARRFSNFLGDTSLTRADKDDVRAYLSTLHDSGFKGSTIAAAVYALRSFYRFLQLGDQVQISAPRAVQTPKVSKRLPHAVSEEDMERIIGAAKSLRDRALLELAYASGLRRSELSQLRVEDVNLQARSLTVRRGKGDKDRIGLFGKPAAIALRAYLGERKHGFVFLRESRVQRGGLYKDRHGVWRGQWRENGQLKTVRLGDYDLPTKERARLALDAFLADKLPQPNPVDDERKLSDKAIWRIVVKCAKRAGVSGVHPHVFRHSCASHCLNHGMDIRHVQELLGHEHLVTTAKYLHVASTNLKATHTKFLERG